MGHPYPKNDCQWYGCWDEKRFLTDGITPTKVFILKAIILAGGSGKRFWPLSDKETPKQFLKLFGKESLIRNTYDRLRERFGPDEILVITNSLHVEMTGEHLPELPPGNIIGEPVGRNTAPACVIGAMAGGLEEIQLVVPADHHISDTEEFWRSFDVGREALEKEDMLITFGIEPRRPETGYGYIKKGEMLNESLFMVKSFKEKPDRKTAAGYMESGKFFWNSGMFMWRGSTLLEEIRKYKPSIHSGLKGVDPRSGEGLEKAYGTLENISIDYAVMERSERVAMVRATFPWSDVGSWNAIRELKGYSKENDCLLLEDSGDVFVQGLDRPVAVMGLEGVIVVDSPNGLLIMKEGKEQKVRKAYSRFVE